MKVPELNLPNNSVIYVQDISSLDNVHSSDVVGIKKIIIPNNYKIKMLIMQYVRDKRCNIVELG